jgi:hypothetical protein
MKNNRTKKTIGFLITIFLGSIVALIILLLLIRTNTLRLAEHQRQITEQDATEATNRALRELLQNQGNAIDALEGHIVAKEGAVSLIESIETLARKQGLEVKVNEVKERDYRSQPATSTSTYEYLDLSLAATGKWQSQYVFLSLLENLPYKIMLQSVALTSSIDVPENSGSASATSTKKIIPKATVTWNGIYTLSVLKYK